MRLLFVILIHNRPAAAVEFARALTDAATDAWVAIHIDAEADPADVAVLSAAVETPRVFLVQRRVRCKWGDFSLVEATLNALAEARAKVEAGASAYDYVVLLSGACLPCRPIDQLQRYLGDNAGSEFIESADESWPIGGLRAERWKYSFVLPPTRYPWLEKRLISAQRLLGVNRRIPSGLTPRLGSQWWALTWETCNRILDFANANPATMRFFRHVWIPDEMVIQTLVHHLVPAERIAGFGLTHYQFTRYGKPVVYYNDHADYVLGLQRFFVRKVSPEATVLRNRCLARAVEPDDGEPLDRIGAPNDDYVVKTRAQTHYPMPGQAFYGSQFDDQNTGVLATLTSPYVVVIAPPGVAAVVLDHLRGGALHALGRIFAADRVDFGPGVEALGGLRSDDVAVRDLHPALYLARVRMRTPGVPVIACSPFDTSTPLDAILDDPAALKIAWLPTARGAETLARKLLDADGDWASLGGPPRFDHPRWREAALATRVLPTAEDRLAKLAELMCDGSRTTVRAPLLPSHDHRGGADAAVLRQSSETCDFRGEAWFGEVAVGLERACSALGAANEGVPLRRAAAAE